MKRIKEKLKKLGFTKKSFLITCGVAVLVLTIATMLVTNYFITNSKEWEKYNGHIDNTFVTNQELEEYKAKLFEESMQVVSNVVSDELVVSKIDYLSKQKLNEEQQQILSNILTVHTSFDETKDYTLDEIIALAADYTKLATNLNSLYTEIKTIELSKAINDLDSKIKKNQEGLAKLTLTDSEQKEFDKQIKLYKDVKFNKDNTYTIEELESLKSKFTDVNKQLESLSKKAKDRIAKEQAEAEKQQAQATVYNQSSGYTDGSYNSNTSSANENTSNAGAVSNQPKSKVCPYSSLEAAVAAGEASGRGYSAGNCGDNSFELRLFDGDHTGETADWLGW